MTSKGLNAGAASFTPTVGGENPPSPAAAGGASASAPARHSGLREDSFNEYAEMMDNIENAMEDEDDSAGGPVPESPPHATSATNVAPQTSLPPHLQKHAQEFWFPECRDCPCCNGFKHGCRCAASNGGACVCAGGGTAPVAAAAPVGAAPGGGGPSQSYPGRGNNININNSNTLYSGGRGRGRAGGRGGGAGGGGGRGRVPCRFFFSQGGCRYGDSCTFSHQQ